MAQVLVEYSSFYATVKNWATEFKLGRGITEHDFCSGCQKTSTTDEQVDAIRHMVLDDSYLLNSRTSKSKGISSGLVHTVLTEILGISEVSARWVPIMLTKAQAEKSWHFQDTSANASRLTLRTSTTD